MPGRSVDPQLNEFLSASSLLNVNRWSLAMHHAHAGVGQDCLDVGPRLAALLGDVGRCDPFLVDADLAGDVQRAFGADGDALV